MRGMSFPMLVDERDGPAETREPAATGRPSRSRVRLRRHISHPELRPEHHWLQASSESADSRLRGSSFPSDPAEGLNPSGVVLPALAGAQGASTAGLRREGGTPLLQRQDRAAKVPPPADAWKSVAPQRNGSIRGEAYRDRLTSKGPARPREFQPEPRS